jgi:hypothetical protein
VPAAKGLRASPAAEGGVARAAEITRRICPHLNRRCPPTVRNDGRIPASAQRRMVRDVTSKNSAISAGRRTSPCSEAGSRTSVGSGSRFALRRTGCFRTGSVLIRRRKSARISASSAAVNFIRASPERSVISPEQIGSSVRVKGRDEQPLCSRLLALPIGTSATRMAGCLPSVMPAGGELGETGTLDFSGVWRCSR